MDNINKENIIGKKVTDVFPSVKEFGLFDVFQRVWRTGEPEHYPISLYEDDRIKGWRENYIYKLPTGEIVVVYDDISERKEAEHKLIESEEDYHKLSDQYRMLLESITDGVYVLDKNWTYLLINNTAADMVKLPVEKLIGNKITN